MEFSYNETSCVGFFFYHFRTQNKSQVLFFGKNTKNRTICTDKPIKNANTNENKGERDNKKSFFSSTFRPQSASDGKKNRKKSVTKSEPCVVLEKNAKSPIIPRFSRGGY